MTAKSQEVAKAVADGAKVFGVPVLGMVGTWHEKIYPAEGLTFLSEYYADLDYADDGSLIITREHHAVDADRAAARALRAVREGVAETVGGREAPVRADCICAHCDTPNAQEPPAEVPRAQAAVRRGLGPIPWTASRRCNRTIRGSSCKSTWRWRSRLARNIKSG
jgi:lactam utilization protein B